MRSARVHREISVLADSFETVMYDSDRNVIIVDDYPLPAGWNHETTTIVIDLPDEYPCRVPDVYVPDDLRFEERTPQMLMSLAPDGWYRYDLYLLSHHWIPERHTVVTVLRWLYHSLNNPNGDNLFDGS